MKRILQIVFMSIGTVLGLLFLFLGVGLTSSQVGFEIGFSFNDVAGPALFLVLACILLFFSVRWGEKQEKRVLAITFLISSVFFLFVGCVHIYNLFLTFPEPPKSMLENMALARALASSEYPVIDKSLINQFRKVSAIDIVGYISIATTLLFISIKWLKNNKSNNIAGEV